MIECFRPIAIILATFAITSGAHAQQAGDPAGVWLTQAGDAKVRVSHCGNELCGVVVWLRQRTNPETGQPFTDDRNPNPALRQRPMIGLPLFSAMRATGPGRWAGRIYNADDGGTYDSHVEIASPNALRVNGCVGGLCGGETWTRTR